jgi:bacterioferritin-associated ferredoxin
VTDDHDMTVGLRFRDADALLALAEWALSRPVVVCCSECGHTARQTLEADPAKLVDPREVSLDG